MKNDRYLALKIIIAVFFGLIFLAILTNNNQIPLSADIITGNSSPEGLAIDFLDWMNNADNQQVDDIAQIYVKGYFQANKPKTIDFDTSKSMWMSIKEDINKSVPEVTFRIKKESVYDHNVYRNSNGQIITKEKYNELKRNLQIEVEKEIDKEKIIERYNKSISPSNELVKRWDEMFEEVMDEADRRMPPIEKIYKSRTYIEYTLKDKKNIRVYINEINNRYYIDENSAPAIIEHESNPIGD